MIYVIASIELKPNQREGFLEHFRALVPLVQGEDGCIEYGPTIDVETNIASQGDVRPDVVTVIEKWSDPKALERHLIAPHMLDYRKKVSDMVEAVSLQIVEPA